MTEDEAREAGEALALVELEREDRSVWVHVEWRDEDGDDFLGQYYPAGWTLAETDETLAELEWTPLCFAPLPRIST